MNNSIAVKGCIVSSVILCLIWLNVGCSKDISNTDIAEGRVVVENFFLALKTDNLEGLNKTLGQYKRGIFTKDNIGRWNPELISIDYPGKLTNDIALRVKKENNLYKVMTYYVTFNEGSEKQAWDWMVVKETKDSSWQIRDCGQ